MFDTRLGYGALILYAIVGTIAVLYKPAWVVDLVVTLAVIGALLLLRKRLRIDTLDFVLANVILLIHNAGFFGLYATSFIVGYDVYAHFFNTGILSILLYRTLHRITRLKRTAMIIMAISITATLALGVELVEYAGQTIFSAQNAAIGLAGTGDAEAAYVDTMKDIFVNLIGATVGAFIAPQIKRKK